MAAEVNVESRSGAREITQRIFIGYYEIRYEVLGATIFVLRIWHTREER
jgi:hypothetical protein